jgi:small subunit ribosomal protein S18
MAGKHNDRDRDRGSSRRGPKDAPRRGKKKVCVFCTEHIAWVDYKDVNLLRRFMSERGKIRARRVTGNCSQHQREVSVAIKTARELALLPYTQRTVSETRGGRGGSGGGGRGPARGAPERVEAEGLPGIVDVDDDAADGVGELAGVGLGLVDGDDDE